MSIVKLIFREIAYRKLNFVLGVVSATAAVGCLVAALILLDRYDAQTERVLAEKEQEVDEKLAAMEDDYRKITLKLGFNVQILPEGQNLHDFWAADFAAKTMPEEYVARLARSDIMTVQHLLPVLEQRCEWPERGRQVLAVGTRSEVPLGHRSPKQPLIQPVEPGTIVLGHELHQSLGIAVGDTVVFRGRELKVVRCHEQRGSKDDITVWINLGEAQELFEKPGSINGILALSCFCEGPRLERIRKEIASILPGTQVIERASQAIARAEARAKAAEVRADAVAAEKAYRERRRGEFETWAAVLVAVVAVGAFVWIGFLALANVRERRGEIGILRALGLGSGAVLAAVLVRSALVGLAGAAVGFGGGLLVGGAAVGSPGLFALLLLGAPLFSAAAGWLPAVAAARQDPAVVLRDE